MKKTLAILLSLALVICMIPGTAFATGGTAPEGGDETPTITVTNFEETQPTITVEDVTYNGKAQEPAVTVKVGEATLKKGTDYTVEYSNNTNAGDARVEITGVTDGAGTTDYSGTATQIFKINKLKLTETGVAIVEKNAITSVEGAKESVKLQYNDYDLTDTVTYTAVAQGTDKVRVTATASGEGNLEASSRTADFYLKAAFDSTYSVEASKQVYDGEKQEPSVTIKKDGKRVYLDEGTDYSVTYSNNISAGTASITVNGEGKYTGTIPGSFTIDPRSIKASGITVNVSSVEQGGEPVVTVKDGDKTLVDGTDYTVIYPSTSKVGSATVEINGNKNYTGTRTASFDIVKAGNTITSAYIDVSKYEPWYSGDVYEPNIKVKIGKEELDEGSSRDYTVKYEYVDAKGKVQTTTAPVDAHEYTIIVTGVNDYAGVVRIEDKFQIIPLDTDYVEITGIADSYQYSGKPVEPTPTVRSILTGGPVFKEGKDYEVSYQFNDKVYSSYLKAKVIIEPIDGGNLTGDDIEAEFSLVGKSIRYCSASFADGRSSSAYTGRAISVDVVVRDGYTKLTKGVDYKVTYQNSLGKTVSSIKDAGRYTILIEGIGSYSGSTSLSYTVTGTDISDYTVTLKTSSVNADGTAKTPVISSVKYGYYSSLSSGDYTVTYEDSTGAEVTSMKLPGTYTVVVTGKNGYMGSTYATFRIVGEPQTMTLSKKEYRVYEGADAFKINVKASGDGTGFTYKSDDTAVATVSSTGYVTVKKPGSATISITTTGNIKSDPVTGEVVIKVFPATAKLSKKPWTDGKGKIKVRWEYDENVTRYQVMYSTSKSFKKGTYTRKSVKAHGKDYTTQSTTISNLKSGKTYYFKVRAIYEEYDADGNKKTYYGKWSTWRSCKAK